MADDYLQTDAVGHVQDKGTRRHGLRSTSSRLRPKSSLANFSGRSSERRTFRCATSAMKQ
jgi:hypothetical protein